MKTKKEIIRYLIVTPFVGATDFGVYYLLILFLPYSVSKAISFIIANGVGYLLNKYWVFKRKQKQPSFPEVSRYLIVDIILFLCNVATNQAILYVWPKAVFLAIAVASIVTALLSFICKKWWVFRTHQSN